MTLELALEIINLSYTYPDGSEALHNIYLKIYQNETLGIIGPNGAGKSTLLLHLNGILPSKGQVQVFNRPVVKKNLKQIRSQVGLVFQDPANQLVMPTLFDDIAFGPLNFGLTGEKVERMVFDIARHLQLTELLNKSPAHLSLGEQKRAALATVLVLEPDIVVFDEPTVSLDPGSRRALIQRIANINKTKIIASHDLDLVVELCDRVVLINQGTIQSVGNTRTILENQVLLEKYNLEVPLSLVLERLASKNKPNIPVFKKNKRFS